MKIIAAQFCELIALYFFQKCLFRSQYDELLVQINRGVLSVETAQSLSNVLRLLLFFYNEKEDAERLVSTKDNS